MSLKYQKLNEIGVDTDGAIKRLAGNEALYLKLCNRFIQDENYIKFQETFSSRDYDNARLRIHTLIGVAANLGFMSLESICRQLLQDIRHFDLKEADRHNTLLQKEYHELIQTIRKIKDADIKT